MCGIAGFLGRDARARATAMMEALEHRGPDDHGVAWTDESALAHTRLAIQDLDSRSRCPFVSGDTVVVYNGELWNTAAVKADLVDVSLELHNLAVMPPIEFTTTGDTEVVAAALDTWGPLALPKLEGMFAIAWSNPQGDIIGLARDRFGEIPVHWVPVGEHYSSRGVTVADGFAFASELKALRGVAPLADARWVEPGHWLEFRRQPTGRWRVETHRWYEAPAEPAEMELVDAGVRMRSLMERAVAERSVSDVPVCTLLSGGIDSTAVAYHLAQHVPDLVAYTAVYAERSQDARMARLAADRLGIQLVEIKVPLPTRADLASVIRRIEMPFKAQVEIGWPCLHLARAMRDDGFKVCFSGEGSDELWASYGFAYYVLQRTFGGRQVFGDRAQFDLEAEREWSRYRRDTFVGQHRKNFPRCNKIFMAHGVECRLPFLHTPLVEFALSVPVDVSMIRHPGKGPSRPKAVMYEAWRGILPDEITTRGKVAFQDGMGIKKAIEREMGWNAGGGQPNGGPRAHGDARSFYNTVYKEAYA